MDPSRLLQNKKILPGVVGSIATQLTRAGAEVDARPRVVDISERSVRMLEWATGDWARTGLPFREIAETIEAGGQPLFARLRQRRPSSKHGHAP